MDFSLWCCGSDFAQCLIKQLLGKEMLGSNPMKTENRDSDKVNKGVESVQGGSVKTGLPRLVSPAAQENQTRETVIFWVTLFRGYWTKYWI